MLPSPSPSPSQSPSPTTSPTSSATPIPRAPQTKTLGIIIGASAGGAAVLAAIAIISFVVIKKRKSQHPSDQDEEITAKATELLNQRWEIPYDSLTILSELGSGMNW